MTSNSTIIPAVVGVDNVMIERNGENQLTLKDSGITTAKLASEVADSIVPVGFVMWRAGNIVGAPSVPSNWQLCNGAVISNANSPMVGGNTPDLINKFVRGSATAGSTGGADSHTTNIPATVGGDTDGSGAYGTWSHLAGQNAGLYSQGTNRTLVTSSASNVPVYATLQPYIRLY